MVDETVELPIPCPKCGHQTKKSIAWIKANDKFVCAGCGSTVNVQAEQLLAGLKQLDETIDDLRRKIRDINKPLKR